MSVTLTDDQAKRLLEAMRYGWTDAERDEFEAILSATDPAWTGKQPVVDSLNGETS